MSDLYYDTGMQCWAIRTPQYGGGSYSRPATAAEVGGALHAAQRRIEELTKGKQP